MVEVDTDEVVLACAAPLPVAEAEREERTTACVVEALSEATDELLAAEAVESVVVSAALVVLDAVTAVVADTDVKALLAVAESEVVRLLSTQLERGAKPTRP